MDKKIHRSLDSVCRNTSNIVNFVTNQPIKIILPKCMKYISNLKGRDKKCIIDCVYIIPGLA